MTIDLKWGLPFVLPFALMGMLRALTWMAGAEWTATGGMAVISLVLGLAMGFIVAAILSIDRTRWTVTIGRKGGEK